MYLQWEASLTPEIAPYFSDITRAWGNWTWPILGYFDHPVTNAYTESLNNLIRVMNRLGRGYSFEALRAKILFAEGAYKRTNSRPRFEKRDRQAVGRSVPGAEEDTGMLGLVTGPSYGMMSRTTYRPPVPSPSQKSAQPDEPEKNYGVDISTLIRMIENGEL